MKEIKVGEVMAERYASLFKNQEEPKPVPDWVRREFVRGVKNDLEARRERLSHRRTPEGYPIMT